MSRNPKADATHLPPTPETLIQMEYNKMNDDEKRRHNLARSQRVEPTGTISPLTFPGAVMRNGLQKPPTPAAAPTPPPQEQQQEEVEEGEGATTTPSGVLLGVTLGVVVAVGVYMGVSKMQSILRNAYGNSQQLVAITPK